MRHCPETVPEDGGPRLHFIKVISLATAVFAALLGGVFAILAFAIDDAGGPTPTSVQQAVERPSVVTQARSSELAGLGVLAADAEPPTLTPTSSPSPTLAPEETPSPEATPTDLPLQPTLEAQDQNIELPPEQPETVEIVSEALPPTATAILPTATATIEQPTATPVPPTPTATAVPSTPTPTATLAIPTDIPLLGPTLGPPTATPEPTNTPANTGGGGNGTVSGYATRYADSLEGNTMACGGIFDQEDISVVAVSLEYDETWRCGDELEICGPASCITGFRQDTCPGCPGAHVDLSRAGLAAVCGNQDGCDVRIRHRP